MTVPVLVDSAGRRRSPATKPGYHAGRPPRNKGQRYPADPPTVEEIIAVMRHADDDRHGAPLRALIVVLWRGGLRVPEALALVEAPALGRKKPCSAVRRHAGGDRLETGRAHRDWPENCFPTATESQSLSLLRAALDPRRVLEVR
jgi:integrase